MNKIFKTEKIKLGQTHMICAACYLYLLQPVFIFVSTWIKPLYAVVCSAVLIVSFLGMLKDTPVTETIKTDKKNIKKLIIIFFIICLITFLSGIGRMVFQNEDHFARNTIYRILVENKWPVIQEVAVDGVKSSRILTYYMGFWLPAAAVGKVFGMQAGYMFQYIWAVLGIFLCYLLFCMKKKKIAVWPLIVMFFFSGLDIAGTFLTGYLGIPTLTTHIEQWTKYYQYSSMMTQLFWVYNQAIPCWLAMMLLACNFTKKNIVLIWGSVMLTSTLPFIGMLPFVIWYLVKDTKIDGAKVQKGKIVLWIKNVWSSVASFQNIAGGGVAGILSFLYLLGNIAGGSIGVETSAGNQENKIIHYVLFLFIEFGFLAILLYKYRKKSIIFYIACISLIIIPNIKVGFSIDFCMRASIPALLVIMYLAVEALEESQKQKNRRRFDLLVLLLLLGGITAQQEINRTVYKTITLYNQGTPYAEADREYDRVMNGKNFSAVVEGNIFVEYFAK